MKNEVRRYTRTVLDLMDQGILRPLDVAKMALDFMSEKEVKDLAESEGWIDPEEEEEEEEG